MKDSPDRFYAFSDVERRRDAIRDDILADVWRSVFPAWILFAPLRSLIVWFERNAVSLGFFITWPRDTDEVRVPVGRRVGVLSVDSPSRMYLIGWARLDSRDLKRVARQGRTLRVRVLGWLRISGDVDGSLAGKVLASVDVIGASRMPTAVRSQLSRSAA